jgi:very-short-patch-repair endonuclease
VAGAFLGNEAIAGGRLTRGQLRWNYRRAHRNVYLPKSAPRSLWDNISAAWLWSGRRGIVAGRAAAALHGARWIDEFAPVEIVGPFNHPPPGIIVRRERISVEDVVELGGLRVTNPARTAFDLARHLPRAVAVSHLDALSAATGLTVDAVAGLIASHKGARGVRQCQTALSLMDGGAQSPKESWLRLVLVDAGLPRPVTQIRITEGRFVAYLDMGWEQPMVAVEYDGDQHRTDRSQYVKDIRRAEILNCLGWQVIRVINEDRPNVVVQRARDALNRRSAPRLP